MRRRARDPLADVAMADVVKVTPELLPAVTCGLCRRLVRRMLKRASRRSSDVWRLRGPSLTYIKGDNPDRLPWVACPRCRRGFLVEPRP